jgi:hypothetical protein
MSSRLAYGFLIGCLLLLCAVGFKVAFASADTLAQTTVSLAPSRAADLLGPISEQGRVGWICHPEKAAAASSAREAELPAVDAPE